MSSIDQIAAMTAKRGRGMEWIILVLYVLGGSLNLKNTLMKCQVFNDTMDLE